MTPLALEEANPSSSLTTPQAPRNFGLKRQLWIPYSTLSALITLEAKISSSSAGAPTDTYPLAPLEIWAPTIRATYNAGLVLFLAIALALFLAGIFRAVSTARKISRHNLEKSAKELAPTAPAPTPRARPRARTRAARRR